MTAFKKILCPTDFSDYSEHALRYAHALAKQFGGTIDCVHVVDMGFLNDGAVDGVYVTSADLHMSLEAVKEQAGKELDTFVQREHFRGIDITPHLRTGHASEEIVRLAEEINADAIVIATHGRSGLGRLVFGSTCDKVLRVSKTPVFSIKPATDSGAIIGLVDDRLDISKILCPLDFSAFSEIALPTAIELAKIFGASIVLSHVVDARFDYAEWTAQAAINNSQFLAKSAEEHLQKLSQQIKDVKTEVHVTVGIPHRVMTDYVEDKGVDLVVMPTHGRKGISHALLGSVAEKLVRHVACPVLTIRPES